MKKVLFLLISLLFLIPVSTYAADVKITDFEINGKNEVTVGEKITLSFKIKTSGLSSKSDSLGIWIAGFKLVYDKNILTPVSISLPGFDGGLTVTDEVIGEAIDDYDEDCVDGLLYCGDFQATVTFFAKAATVSDSVDISVKDIGIGLLDMKEDRLYTEDDLITIESDITKTKTIKVYDAVSKDITPPPSIATTSEPKKKTTTKKTNKKTSSSTSSNTTTSTNKNSKKSSNNNLKSLTIDDYKIDFKKEQHLYSIDLVNNTNKLVVKAATEDKKATYKIIGADDLKKNDYKVKIEVTAENGDKSTYSITAYQQETKKDEKKKLIDINIKKDDLIKYGIIGGVVVLVIIIISLIIHHKDHKLEKSLDEL